MNKKNIYIRTTIWTGIFVFLTFLLPAITFTDQGYDLDEFDDLELESVDRQKKKNAKRTNDGQRLILFDDNLYLLDDDFDFGGDELELPIPYHGILLTPELNLPTYSEFS